MISQLKHPSYYLTLRKRFEKLEFRASRHSKEKKKKQL
jgi:hypothetical protein